MKSLFNMASSVGSPVMYAANWNYVRTGLTQNLGKIIQFYRRNPMAVQSDHFLIRLLQSITIPLNMTLERYYSNVDSLSLNLSMALKMTSSIYKGGVFDGVFYGPGSPEILIAHDESFDPLKAHRNWKNLTPVKVLTHPFSDLSMNLPNGTKRSTETGISVFSIDIPLLAVMYRAWRLAEIEATVGTGDSLQSPMQFIHMYVLPNMLFSHMDHVLNNRMFNLITYQDNARMNSKHSFYLTDFSDKCDATQKTMINQLLAAKRNFVGILKSLPAMSRETMFEAMELPLVAPTRQVLWGLVVSRMLMLQLLIELSDDQFRTKNGSEVNYMLREFTRYKTDGTLRDTLPMRLYYDVQYDIDWIITRLSTS